MEINVLDRRKTDCLKWDGLDDERILPMWVADMEFETLPEIIKALQKRAGHGAYGYSIEGKEYRKTVCGWMLRRFGWQINEEWIVQAPGNVAAAKMAIQTFTSPGDKILIQEPVYYVFREAIEENKRVVVSSDLVDYGGHYMIDYEDFERTITENNVKTFILCNPHNPVGRVFTEQEMKTLGAICAKHHVLVICDEVHSDFILEGKHTPFVAAAPECADNSIVLTGPNKTFNLAGLKCANVIIKNEEMRGKYLDHLDACGMYSQNLFSYIACETAYRYGDDYVESLCRVIKSNYCALKEFTEKEFPNVTVYPLEGTYLAWIDIKKLKIPDDKLHEFLTKEAGVYFDEGELFGEAGRGFIRINIACAKTQIIEAMERLKRAVVKNDYCV